MHGGVSVVRMCMEEVGGGGSVQWEVRVGVVLHWVLGVEVKCAGGMSVCAELCLLHMGCVM